MVQTLASTVSGAERRRELRYHAVGLVAGSLTMAFVLFMLGEGLRQLDGIRSAIPFVLLALAGGWALKVATGTGLAYPRSRWQVPESWRQTLPGLLTITLYGYLLGLGFLTEVVMPTYWLLVALSLSVGSLAAVVLAWVGYAAVRAVVTARGAAAVGTDGSRVFTPPRFAVARYGTLSLLLAAVVIGATGAAGVH